MIQLPKPRLISYLRDTFRIESRTIRVPWYNGGNPVFGYVGVCFSGGYQELIMDLADDDADSDLGNQTIDDEEDAEYRAICDDDWKPDFEPCGELTI